MRKAVLVVLSLVFASLIGTGVYLLSINHPTTTPEVVTTTVTPIIEFIPNKITDFTFGGIRINSSLPSITNFTKITYINELVYTTTTTIYVTQPPPSYASLWPIFLGAGIIGIVALTFRAIKKK